MRMGKQKQNVGKCCKGVTENYENIVEISEGQIPDANNRIILKDATLCLQYLQDYVDDELFKDVRPEDIEDMTEKYQAYLGISFESDTVKKIHIRSNDEKGVNRTIYLISLIEHKSQVDYDVTMQLLRYMVCIWNEYAKEIEKQLPGSRSSKAFRYPPIIPVVHYEGVGEWTGAMRFKERISIDEGLEQYIPDFTYKLVSTQRYSNEELLAKENEMSLFMMFNKIQTAQELVDFLKADRLQIEDILKNTSKPIRDIMAVVLWNVLVRMNATKDEAEQCVAHFRKGHMGNWFENMEKMDIQAERRRTEEARTQGIENQKKSIISSYQDFNATKEATVKKLMEECGLSEMEAKETIKKYWK